MANHEERATTHYKLKAPFHKTEPSLRLVKLINFGNARGKNVLATTPTAEAKFWTRRHTLPATSQHSSSSTARKIIINNLRSLQRRIDENHLAYQAESWQQNGKRMPR